MLTQICAFLASFLYLMYIILLCVRLYLVLSRKLLISSIRWLTWHYLHTCQHVAYTLWIFHSKNIHICLRSCVSSFVRICGQGKWAHGSWWTRSSFQWRSVSDYDVCYFYLPIHRFVSSGLCKTLNWQMHDPCHIVSPSSVMSRCVMSKMTSLLAKNLDIFKASAVSAFS